MSTHVVIKLQLQDDSRNSAPNENKNKNKIEAEIRKQQADLAIKNGLYHALGEGEIAVNETTRRFQEALYNAVRLLKGGDSTLEDANTIFVTAMNAHYDMIMSKLKGTVRAANMSQKEPMRRIEELKAARRRHKTSVDV